MWEDQHFSTENHSLAGLSWRGATFDYIAELHSGEKGKKNISPPRVIATKGPEIPTPRSMTPLTAAMTSQDSLEARLARWEERLRSLTTASLTTDYVRPDPPRIVEAVHSVTVSEATRLALLQLGILDGSNPVSPFTVLLAAFAVLAFRLTGDEDISVGTTAESKEPFVLRMPVTAQTTFVELLKSVKEVRVLSSCVELR